MNKTTELHNLLNKERTKRGLSYLRWNQGLYRRCKNHSLFMLKNGKLRHAPDIPSGGECIWGGKGSHSPATAVKSWMNSPPHRALILSPKVKSHAVAIVWGRNGTYATWRGSRQAIRTAKPAKRVRKSKTIRLDATGFFKVILSVALGLGGLLGIFLGVHGLYVHFNVLDLLLGGDGTKFLLMIDVPTELKGLVMWASSRGLQSWVIPAFILVAGLFLFTYSQLWLLTRQFFNKLRV